MIQYSITTHVSICIRLPPVNAELAITLVDNCGELFGDFKAFTTPLLMLVLELTRTN